jgi:hypothetical protein
VSSEGPEPVETLGLRDRAARKLRHSLDRVADRRAALVHAGVLDGDNLWLTAEADEGTLSARHHTHRELVPLPAELLEQRHGQLSFRADLTALRGDAPATYDLMLVRQDKILSLSGPASPAGPMVAPPTRDGRHQFTLRHRSSGALQLHVAPTPAQAELVALTVVEAGIEVAVRGVSQPAALTLRTDQDELLASFPMVVEDGVGRGVLTPDRLPESGPAFCKVAVGAEQSLLVRRPRNELRHPNDAVVLPELVDVDGLHAVARLRWSPSGVLAIRLTAVEPDETGGGDA